MNVSALSDKACSHADVNLRRIALKCLYSFLSSSLNGEGGSNTSGSFGLACYPYSIVGPC